MHNSRNLAFFKVISHEKILFGMYVVVWHVFGVFDCRRQKKVVSHFVKPDWLRLIFGICSGCFVMSTIF